MFRVLSSHSTEVMGLKIGCKRNVVVLTSVPYALPFVLFPLAGFLSSNSAAWHILERVVESVDVGLMFYAWRLLAQAGAGKKWRLLVLMFGPLAAVMLPSDKQRNATSNVCYRSATLL